MKGRIIEVISNLYKIENQEKKIYQASPRGILRKEETSPVVGDLVEFEVIDEIKKEAVINKITKRTVYIKRPKMANITKLIFVVSSKDPKPDLLMLDKQLVFAEFLKLEVCIVLNKTDLDKKKEFEKIKEIYEKIGYKVLLTQANDKQGIEEVKKELKGNINAFSGNSGVGKSTLINGLFQEDMTKEGEISKRNQRGKNTTTSTKLYKLKENTYIADTPGFSTFSIEEIESRELAKYFKEFKSYINKCEFVGCTHIKEENCGIKQAICEGEIHKSRYDRFCKIYQELKIKEERKKW